MQQHWDQLKQQPLKETVTEQHYYQFNMTTTTKHTITLGSTQPPQQTVPGLYITL